MIKKSKTKFKDGTYKTQIRVVEGVRIGNKITHHHIKGFGYLEDQTDQEAFMKMVNEYDKNYQSSKKISLELDTKESWLDNTDDDSVYNFGYKFLESIYDSLEIKEFFRTISFQGRYLLDDVFKYFHDVDLNPQNSLRFAKIQHELGIHGSYFFRVGPESWDE